MRRMKCYILVIILVTAGYLPAGELSNFFWEVDNGDITVYLCGSVHLMKEEYYPLRDEIENAFTESEILVLEVDMNKLDLNKIQEMIINQGYYQDERSLESELPAEYYTKLKSELADSEIDIELVKTQKPWYLTMTLSSVRISNLGYNVEGGTDLYFSLKAGDNKEIQQLETPEAQFELLSSMGDSLQIEYLKDLIDQREEFDIKVEELMQSWKAGDAETMYRLMNEELKDNPELAGFYEKLFTERNISMTDKIEGYLKADGEKKYFVVVGSGHFLGEDGIVQLLRNRGYEIIRK